MPRPVARSPPSAPRAQALEALVHNVLTLRRVPFLARVPKLVARSLCARFPSTDSQQSGLEVLFCRDRGRCMQSMGCAGGRAGKVVRPDRASTHASPQLGLSCAADPAAAIHVWSTAVPPCRRRRHNRHRRPNQRPHRKQRHGPPQPPDPEPARMNHSDSAIRQAVDR
jgi:hypothetical protein